MWVGHVGLVEETTMGKIKIKMVYMINVAKGTFTSLKILISRCKELCMVAVCPL